MPSPTSPKPRPAPTRSLRQPQSLSVNEKGIATSSSSSTSRPTDSAQLRQSFQDRAEANKAVMIAMESLLEDTVSRADFKKACTYLLPSSYLSILHERHLSTLCSHPLCPNPPHRPFTSFSTPRSRILRDPLDGSKRIVEVSGNEEDGFCSRECWKRSEWVRRSGMLGEEGRWLREKEAGLEEREWELLEEVEERLKREQERKMLEDAESGRREGQTSPSTPELATLVPPPTTASPVVTVSLSTPAISSSTPPIPSPPATASPTSSSAPSPSPLTGPAALIASLTIKERSTPSSAPLPPSLNPQPPHASPSSSSPSPRASNPSAKIGAFPPPMTHKTAARLKEERRRADASAGALIPGSVGKLGDVLVEGVGKPGKGMGKFEKTERRRSEGREESAVSEGAVVDQEEEEEEDVDGLRDVWEEMYKARDELEGGEGGGEMA